MVGWNRKQYYSTSNLLFAIIIYLMEQTLDYSQINNSSTRFEIAIEVQCLSLSRKQVIIVGIILAIVGLLSPFYSRLSFSSYEISFRINTLFLMIGANYPRVFHIDFNEFWVIAGNLPFVIFRLGVPIQFMRYYEMKASRYELLMTGLAGEIPPLILILGLHNITSFVAPLPFHLLICIIVIYFRPVNDNEDVFHEYESLYSYDDLD